MREESGGRKRDVERIAAPSRGAERVEASASVSAILANATRDALRTARRERATRWGARVLWGGCVASAALAWRGEDASALGAFVATLILAAWGVGVAFSRKKATAKGEGERRVLALSAARRLERRFPEQAGVLSAAVDFCEEESGRTSSNVETTSDSAALRRETVATATRWLAEEARKMERPVWQAILADEPVERLRGIGRTRRLFALGVLANLAIWSAVGVGRKEREENGASALNNGARIAASPSNAADREDAGKSENNKTEAIKENAGNAEDGQIKENGGNGEVGEKGKDALDAEITLAALELLISEFAQNAEIAELLETELTNAAAVERNAREEATRLATSGANAAPSFNATLILQLARELNSNLTRPERGLAAQIERLTEAARRDEESGENDETRAEEEIGRISGKRLATRLLLSRLERWEKRSSAFDGWGDATSLELSFVLRSDSAEERAEILTSAARRVGERAATLRREETAARILVESWQFDAASQNRASFARGAAEANRSALARFAGRLPVETETSAEETAFLTEAKRRLRVAWAETRRAENERFAIVERLRERLQNEEAREFVAFLKETGAEAAAVAESDEQDARVANALSDAASLSEKRDEDVLENIEANRFGIVAETLEKVVSSSVGLETSASVGRKKEGKKENFRMEGKPGRVVTEGGAESLGTARDENANVDDASERRFAALAAFLTFGVDSDGKVASVEGTQALARQTLGKRRDEAALKGDAASTREKENDGTEKSRKEERATAEVATSETSPNEQISDATSQNAKEAALGKTAEATGGQDDVASALNDDNANGWEESAEEDGSAVGEGKNASGSALGTDETLNKSVRPDAATKGSALKTNVAKSGERLDVKTFNAELPSEARGRIEGIDAPETPPEYEEKNRLYRRRILEGKRR